MKKTNFLLPVLMLLWALPGMTQWSSFCTGQTNGFIVEFDEHEDELYATGFFTRIGGRNARYFARWSNLLETWQQVGNIGLPEEGHAMHSWDGALHVAAYHFATDSNYVYRWNSSIGVLSALGDGFFLTNATGNPPYVPSLYDLTDFNDRMVVCGEFNRIGSQSISGIAAWDGAQWVPLGAGLAGAIPGTFNNIMAPHKMLSYGGSLYVVGNFRTAGNVEVNGVARWTGLEWEAMGSGFNGSVYGIEVYQGDIYVGGSFSMSGDTPVGNIARWNGTAWESVGMAVDYIPDVQAFVHTLKTIGNKLYLLGGFDTCTDAQGNALPCRSILAYDGTNWDGLDGGVQGEAEAIIPYEGAILIGGDFTAAGGLAVNSMALWGTITAAEEPVSSTLPTRLSPNPSSGWFRLELPAEVHRFSYQLYSPTGQLVLSGQAASGELIQADHLPPGYYTLQGHCDQGQFQHKLILY